MMHNTLACVGLASNDNSERNGILFSGNVDQVLLVY